MNTYSGMKKYGNTGMNIKHDKKDDEIKNLKAQLAKKNKELEEKSEELNKEIEISLIKDTKIMEQEQLINELKQKLKNSQNATYAPDSNNKLITLQNKLKESEEEYQDQMVLYDNLNKEFQLIQKENKELKNKLKALTSSPPNTTSIASLENTITDNTIKTSNDHIKALMEELEKERKNNQKIEEKFSKENEELKNRCDKEMELISSAIYNLGFNFWSMKYTYEEKLKRNKNWLDLERTKQYNGDY